MGETDAVRQEGRRTALWRSVSPASEVPSPRTGAVSWRTSSTWKPGIRIIEHRLSLPVGQKGAKKAPGGYRSGREWHAKSRRLRVLQDRLTAARADREAGIVHVVRGGRRLTRTRHHLPEAQLTESGWRGRWEAERWFCQADGESGKRYGNETIRVSPDGEVSIKLPACSRA